VRALEDPVETGRHSLGIIAVVTAIAAIVLVGGFFLWLPPLPGHRPMRLQRLTIEVPLLFLLLFQVHCGLLLFCELSPPVTIHFVLLYWRPRGSSVDQSLHGQRWVLKVVEEDRDSRSYIRKGLTRSIDP